MKEPSAAHQARHNKKNAPVVPVVIDPKLARHLRPHQVDGVKFLYESVMGMRKHEGYGCILADEMEDIRTLGAARSDQLQEISKSFMLRRTADILSNYLPPKNEYVVFIKPTALQLSIFDAILKPEVVDDVVHGSMAKSLALIQLLTKVCNSPYLLKKLEGSAAQASPPPNVKAALSLLPSSAGPEDFSLSGKLTFLGNLLDSIRNETEEKVVLVSNYTATLDVIEKFCVRKKYSYFRLDGTKAGGVGLNLIGASRLVLIDSDWNPAHDLQAMARIHRDGQKRPVFIYRLVTAGSIDEKIFQRQVTKIGLSDSLMATQATETSDKASKDDFTPSQLKDLFTVNTRTACHTHELLECDCMSRFEKEQQERREREGSSLERLDLEDNTFSDDDGDHCSDSDLEELPELPKGFVTATEVDPEKEERKLKKWKQNTGLAVLQEWTHINCLRSSAKNYIKDGLLQQLLPAGQSVNDTVGAFSNSLRISSPSPSNNDAHGLPGGTITFVFEKKGKPQMDLGSS
ncbi:helicase [Tulasnella sp. 408]|nr:helicase [Tulasnella sp. 408]